MVEMKVYSDGGHFIGILSGFFKAKKKGKNRDYTIEVNGKTVDLKETYNEKREKHSDKKKKDRTEEIIKEMASLLIGGEEEARAFVESQNLRIDNNTAQRMKLLFRRVRLLFPNYFCTFTYDSKKHNAETFKSALSRTLNNFSVRYGWKYVGAWEEGAENGRVHFHALIRIPEGQMKGELVEKKDFDTKHKRMQTTTQNTYFNERFGRTDFDEINEHVLDASIKYLIKYIDKSNKKLVYARGVLPYVKVQVQEDDILCWYGEENSGKVLLSDNFLCIQNGEVFGNACPEVINLLEKCN